MDWPQCEAKEAAKESLFSGLSDVSDAGHLDVTLLVG